MATTNKDVVESLGASLSAFETLTGGANDFSTATRTGMNALVGFTQALGDAQGAGDLAAGMLVKLNQLGQKMAAILEKQTARVETFRIGLNRAGVEDSRAFIGGLRKQQDALMDYGVTLENLNKTALSFREGLRQLQTEGFPAQENALRKIAVVNERFGISIDTSIELINNLDTGFSMAGQASDKFSRQLLGFAQKTGQPFNKVFQDFNKSIKTWHSEMDPQKALSKFTVFQQMARRFGTEISDLTRLTDKFETIEGGMEFGGNLNMLLSNLGGSFDAVEATLMSQPERLKYITQQIQGVAGEIEGMTDLGQRAILKELSEQVGVDVGTIRAMMDKTKGGDLERFLSGSKNLGEMNAAEQKRIADENTTRAEKQQQVSDQMISKFAIAAERTAQAATRMSTAVQGATLKEVTRTLDKVAPQLNAMSGKLETATKGLKDSNADYLTKMGTLIENLTTSSNTIAGSFSAAADKIDGSVRKASLTSAATPKWNDLIGQAKAARVGLGKKAR